MGGNLQFEVATETLRSVADQFGQQSETAGQIADAAREADVDTKSWGLLGLGLGMYAQYSSARSTADGSIGEIKSFLSDAQTALQATAADYERADRSGSDALTTAGEPLS